jgi:hypothetical protein
LIDSYVRQTSDFKKDLHSYAFNNMIHVHFMVDPKEHWARKAEDLKKAGKFEEAIGIL